MRLKIKATLFFFLHKTCRKDNFFFCRLLSPSVNIEKLLIEKLLIEKLLIEKLLIKKLLIKKLQMKTNIFQSEKHGYPFFLNQAMLLKAQLWIEHATLIFNWKLLVITFLAGLGCKLTCKILIKSKGINNHIKCTCLGIQKSVSEYKFKYGKLKRQSAATL